ncbi:MAG: nucleotidyltransferase family protein [Rikenellaceae bacterium]
MNGSKEQLLELTRCALWGGELSPSLFEMGVNWDELLQLAKEQTLLGVVSTAIERLPLSLRPTRATALRLHQMVTLNRQYRGHQVEVLRELLKLVHRAGVERPVLLKGLGVGLNYPDPTVKQCGDIDLYVGKKHYLEVCEFISKELEITIDTDHSDHHFEFRFMGINIEIHKYATAINSVAFRSREFNQWSIEQLEGDELREVSIDGVSVHLPPYNFDFIFIFFHFWRHFLMGGIGLRQICDWGCYVSRFSDKIDSSEVKRLISRFRLERPISLFATIAVKALGVSPNNFFGYASIDYHLYESAMERVWSRGNFGFYNVDLKRRKRGFVARKSLGVVALFRDMGYLMTIDWHYALRFYTMSLFRGVHLALREIDHQH